MIYLDHHAASPPNEAVLDAMDRAAREAWGNPSSTHAVGRRAHALLERGRDQVAAAFGARARDVIFTSGGTEACNLGVLGLASEARGILTNAIEHPAVSAAVERLEVRGLPVVRLSARADLAPDLSAMRRALPEPGWLVVWQWVNHETGAVQAIEGYAAACRAAGARLFVDATQGVGKLPLGATLSGAHAFAIAGSKLSGPAASGALVLGDGVEPTPQLVGGGQESGRRGGSPNVSSAVGLGLACAALAARLEAMPRVELLRDRLEAHLVSLGGVVNGAEGPRVSTVVNVSLPSWRSDHLVAALDVEGLACSSGAACSSGLGQSSPVLGALYPDDGWRASHALRLSLGPTTTEAEVEQAMVILSKVVARASRP